MNKPTFTLFLCIGLILTCQLRAQTDGFLKQLEKLPGVTAVKALEKDSSFSGIYLLKFTQPIDHQKPDGEKFTQRVFLAHKDFSKSMVMETEGYGLRKYRPHELVKMLNSNHVKIEHRYFGESLPENHREKWEYLTIEQAANDHHRIREMLKPLYPQKWISTGISKGGQGALYYRYFFPDDVDITIGYVCPINFSDTDIRVDSFLATIGDSNCHAKIYQYQRDLLSRKTELLPLFRQIAKEKKYTFERLGAEKAFEYTVLEYAFSFWQWNSDCASIPKLDASSNAVLNHLNNTVSFYFFSDAGIKHYEPFFYQATTEIGYYGYRTAPFSEFIKTIKTASVNFLAPQESTPIYNPKPLADVNQFLQETDKKIIYVYGELDPWSSTRFLKTKIQPNSMMVIKKGGTHLTRIKNLPEAQKNKVLMTVQNWLKN